MCEEIIQFGNIKFRGLNTEILLREEDGLKVITTVNAEFIVKANMNKTFLDIINNSYATFDGQITYYLAKIRNLNKKFEVVSGCDFIDDVCKFCQKYDKKIFLLGGYEQSNKIAVKILKEKYIIKITGFSPEYKPYPFDEKHNSVILEKIIAFKPDFLFVGFGALKQEMWIHDNKEFLNQHNIKWAIGSGGTFEFVAGLIKKPPLWLKTIGLFSIVRLIQEPRMFRLKRILLSLQVVKYLFSK